jgi:SRSO17 transposase
VKGGAMKAPPAFMPREKIIDLPKLIAMEDSSRKDCLKALRVINSNIGDAFYAAEETNYHLRDNPEGQKLAKAIRDGLRIVRFRVNELSEYVGYADKISSNKLEEIEDE